MLTILAISAFMAPPNIVVIFSDDHARQAISAYGSNLTKTPNIDALAANGALFERCYTSNPICAPSRATLLTGKYSHINGHRDNSTRFDGSQPTFPKILRTGGYRTAWIGKWHLESDPTGFDHWEILPGQGQYYNPDFRDATGSHREIGYATDLITEKSLAWLSANSTGPFCLVVGHKAPHRQWQPAIRHLNLFQGRNLPEPANLQMDYSEMRSPAADVRMRIDRDLRVKEDLLVDFPPQRMNPEQLQAWKAAITAEDRQFRSDEESGRTPIRLHYQRYIKNYLRCVASIDESVGRIVESLKKLGLDRNTVLIYASDQGFFLGEFGWYDKRLFHEPSAGTPFIVSTPDLQGKKRRVKEVVGNVDFAPTILEIAGLPVPKEMNGRSVASYLKDRSPKTPPRFAYGHFYESDDPDHQAPKYVSLVGPREKLIFYYEKDGGEFFDLSKDPQEGSNLINDLQAKPRIWAMFERLIDRMNELGEDSKVIESTRKFSERFRRS